MIVPHGTSKPRQITITASFLIFTFFTWIGLTCWASYTVAQHVDYIRSNLYAQMLRIKVAYLGNEIRKFNDKMSEVKDVETKLQTLLQMGSRRAIIQNDETSETKAQGGPTTEDRQHLNQVLEGKNKSTTLAEVESQLSQLNEEYGARLENYEQITKWITLQRKLFRATPRGWPTLGHVTSGYGFRESDVSGLVGFHSGIDVAGAWGTPIRATADGIVTVSGWEGGYGNLVVITHGFGYSSLYGHLSRSLVRQGQKVHRHQVIALMGATGRATGPHCHYEVWRDGRTVDPAAYMFAQGPKHVLDAE